MGKAILIIIAAATLSGAILMHNAQRAAFDTDRRTSEYESEIIATEIARSALNMAVAKVKREWDSIDSDRSTNQPYQKGDYDVEFTRISQSTIQVDVEGRFNGESHALSTTLVMASPFDAAIVVEAPSAAATFSGSSFGVIGHDTPPPSATSSSRGPGIDKHAIKTNLGSVRNAFSTALGDGRAEKVVGLGGEKDIVTDRFDVDMQDLYQEAKAQRDLVLNGGTISGGYTYGSAMAPAIVFIDGNANIQGNISGYGMLVVEGDLTVSGNLTWEGIVMARKETSMSVTYGGSAEIYGSLVLLQGSSAFSMPVDGRLNVRYLSSAAGLQSSVSVEPFGMENELMFTRGSNRTGDQMDDFEKVYPAGTQMNFFISVFQNEGGGWTKMYDHYARGHEVPEGMTDSGKPYAQVVKTGEYTWRIEFEDLDRTTSTEFGGGPAGSIDWDYNDQVIEVEIIPDDADGGFLSEAHIESPLTPIGVSEDAFTAARLATWLTQRAHGVDAFFSTPTYRPDAARPAALLIPGGESWICRVSDSASLKVGKDVGYISAGVMLFNGEAYSGECIGGDNGNGQDKVTICHIPPGNPSNAHTLSVGAPAVDAHLAHGDYLGECGREHDDGGGNDKDGGGSKGNGNGGGNDDGGGSDDDGGLDLGQDGGTDDVDGPDDDGSGTDDGGELDPDDEQDDESDENDDDGSGQPCAQEAGGSQLCFTMTSSSKVYYSAEAIARLSSRLANIREAARIVVADKWVGQKR